MIPGFLVDWARQPGPDKVLALARDRLEQGRLGHRGVLNVTLQGSERQSVGRLLPATWTSTNEPVRVQDLREGLAEHGVSLEDLLAALGGPLRDRPAERREARERSAADREAALDRLRGLLGVPTLSALEPAIRATLGRWVLRRAPASARAEGVATVIEALPAGGSIQLAVLAATTLGDAHALDRSQTLGRTVARFLAVRAAADAALTATLDDLDETAPRADPAREPSHGHLDIADPVATPEGWRAAWASVGVACDTVSSQVLVLNLDLVGDAPAVALCAASPGEPVWLTLRSLSGAFALASPSDVFVCENPSVVEAAADAFGSASYPVVCTFGRPTATAWALLEGLGPDARLRVRADGDVTGWSIVQSLMATFPNAVEWRMPKDCSLFEEELVDEQLADLGWRHVTDHPRQTALPS